MSRFHEQGIAYSDFLQHPCLSTAIQSAAQAGEIILKYFQTGFEVRDKGAGDLVTTADVEAERAILETIHRSYPDHIVLAEESASDLQKIKNLWIVDPLDGTNNFAHGLPHFSVSIAFAREDQVELGVVFNPVHGEWYVTVRGQGAFYNGRKCHVNEHRSLDQTMVACGFYYDRGAMMEATLEAIKHFFYAKIHGIRRFGSAALDLGMVGRGIFGTFFEYQLQPWDHAAAGLFIEEAGGRITDCTGQPLQLYQKTSILASNSHLHEASLEIAQRCRP